MKYSLEKSIIKEFYVFRLLLLISFLISAPVAAESVFVKYRGEVPLDNFDCPVLKDSSLVKRICYDHGNSYLIVLLNKTYYHYCEVDSELMESWISAPSLGRFYGSRVRGAGYDCRGKQVPQYGD